MTGWQRKRIEINPLPAETDAASFKTGSCLFLMWSSPDLALHIFSGSVFSGSVRLCCCRLEVHQTDLACVFSGKEPLT